jgi:hypothetical protein
VKEQLRKSLNFKPPLRLIDWANIRMSVQLPKHSGSHVLLFGQLYSSRGVAVLYIDNTGYTHNIPFLLCSKIKLACFTLHASCFMLHAPYPNKNFLSLNLLCNRSELHERALALALAHGSHRWDERIGDERRVLVHIEELQTSRMRGGM